MTNFLIKLFVRDYDKTDDAVVRKSYGMLSSVVGIICNILIFTSKLIIGTLVNSISIISDGFNNMSDCASCVVAMFGYKAAAKPADREHPFGHGRMEYITSLVIAAAVTAVGLELLKSSVLKIANPDSVSFSAFACIILIVSIFIKAWMAVFNLRLGRKINSSVMLATAKDSASDVLATFAALIAVIAPVYTDAPVDGIIGAVVSVMIIISGIGIIRDTVDLLLGKPADAKLVAALEDMISESTVSLGMHDLIIHSYGPANMIGSVHIEVDAASPILDIHDAIDELERNIYEELHIKMTIHMDPIETNNPLLERLRKIACEAVRAVDVRLSIHDFRAVSGPTHTNLIFDVLVPYEVKLSEKEIKALIDKELAKHEETYYAVITFDKSYC